MKLHMQPKQDELYDLITATGPNVATIIGGGGAKGGGKSRGTRSIIIQAAIDLGKKFPGINITVVRRVSRDLADNHIDPIFRENPDLLQHWCADPKQIRLPGLGVISYRYAEDANDVKRKFLGGYESAIIIVDEAQQFTQEELQWIQAACRWTDAAGIPEGLCKLVLLFNPGGLSNAYLRRIFWLRKYEGREKPHSYAFVHIFGWDNYEWFRGQVPIEEREFYDLPSMCDLGSDHLGHGRCCRFHLFVRETTEGQKYNAYPQSIRMGYLLGNFDHFEGQYFAGVWSERTCTISAGAVERIVQPWWRRWMSLDWGFAHWASCFWFVTGRLKPDNLALLGIDSAEPRDVIIVYREHVKTRVEEFALGQQIVDLTPEPERREITRWFVGHDCFSKDRFAPNTPSVLIEAATKQAGLPAMEKAVIDRVAGARTLHDMLRRTNALRSGSTEDSGTGPIMLISDSCPHLIAAIPVLICDPDKLEDVFKPDGASINDDVYDGWRYGVESWIKAKTQAPVDVRAREVYDSYSDETYRALKMKQFAEQERTKTLPGRRFR